MIDPVSIKAVRAMVLIRGKVVADQTIVLPQPIGPADVPKRPRNQFAASHLRYTQSWSEASLPTFLVSIGEAGALDHRTYAGSQAQRVFAGRDLSFPCREPIQFSAPSLFSIRDPHEWKQKKEIGGEQQEGPGIDSDFYYPIDGTPQDERGKYTGFLLQLGPPGRVGTPQLSSRHWHSQEVEYHFRLLGSLRLGTGRTKDHLSWEPLERHVVTPKTWHQVEKDPEGWSVTLIIVKNLQTNDVRRLNHNRE